MILKLAQKETSVIEAVDNYLLNSIKEQKHRTYLGGSVIGKECDRELWYNFHEPVKNDNPRVQRIFDFGHLLESYVIALLKHSGFQVYHDDGSGQYGFTDEEVGGNVDGIIMLNDEPHLLEIKSASDKRFNEMVKLGVRQSDPVYYTQMQTYMHYMELEKGLFLAINKNDCTLHTEIVEYSRMEAEYAIKRGKEIVRSKDPPERKYKSKAFYRCKFCNFRDRCWNGSNEES